MPLAPHSNNPIALSRTELAADVGWSFRKTFRVPFQSNWKLDGLVVALNTAFAYLISDQMHTSKPKSNLLIFGLQSPLQHSAAKR